MRKDNSFKVTILEHLSEVIRLRFEALKEQITEAKRLMEDRMKDFPGQFLKRDEGGEIVSKLEMLIEFKNKAEGMATQKEVSTVFKMAVIGILIGALSVLIAIISLLTNILKQ